MVDSLHVKEFVETVNKVRGVFGERNREFFAKAGKVLLSTGQESNTLDEVIENFQKVEPHFNGIVTNLDVVFAEAVKEDEIMEAFGKASTGEFANNGDVAEVASVSDPSKMGPL